MIVWLNGTFGVGKTTTAGLLQHELANSRVFDPEHIGYMLSANFRDRDIADFQDLPPWRELVPRVLHSVASFTNSTVIAPQSVLVEQYWDEISAGISATNMALHHVVLDCSEATLRSRIDADQVESPARQWRHDHIAAYVGARAWMHAAADHVIDTSDMDPDEVATAIVSGVDDVR